jgi:predicted TIM-barrel fold metal-dependent hydrolase
LNRRTFLKVAVADLASHAVADEPSIPIIDSHIHLFDTTRPQGVPWPPKDNAVLYRPALPARYEKIARPFGVVAAIEIEASPWLEDNQWVLDLAAKNPIIVGTVGHLEPGQPEFRSQLERFHRNPLFRGIRYGNLWGRDLGARLSEPAFVADLKLLQESGLELDTANPDPALIHDVVRLTDRLPSLRIIVDHLPQLQPPSDPNAQRSYERDLLELGNRPNVYVKVSQVLRKVDGRVPLDSSLYKPILDRLWEIFSSDRLIYGSDWPNSDLWGTYAQVIGIVRQYFLSKGRDAAEKYFWKNSGAAYRWVRRTADQPS